MSERRHDRDDREDRAMSTSIFMRSIGSLALTWGAIACAPAAPANRDTAAIDSVASADSAATSDTTPADSAVNVEQPRTEPAEQSPITPIRTLPATGGIRDGRGARDSAMVPDFNDPAKRLPPAP